MDDKVFNLLEKMYVEMQDGFNKLNTELEEVKTEVKQNSKDILMLENKIDDKLSDCLMDILPLLKS